MGNRDAQLPDASSDREITAAVERCRTRSKTASPEHRAAKARRTEALMRLRGRKPLHKLCHNTVLMLAEKAAQADAENEQRAMWAGRALSVGYAPRHCLWLIANWKSSRRREDTLKNEDQIIRQVIADALSYSCATRAANILGERLHGVGIPMASAILTCLDTKKYTVIDVRTLDALGLRGTRITAEIYGAYLDYCRWDAARLNVSLRELDLALWYYGLP